MEWANEEWQFKLNYAGRNAGTGRWLFGHDGEAHVIRAEYQFQGGLGNAKRVQTSRLQSQTHLPTRYIETGERGNFETRFDAIDGTLHLRQNNDQAQQALIRDYHDPLSLLQALRELNDDVKTWRVDLVGGTVLVTRLENQTLTNSGHQASRLARVYHLRPGNAFVYLDDAAPHRVLKMEQPIGAHVLETILNDVRQIAAVRIPMSGGANPVPRGANPVSANSIPSNQNSRGNNLRGPQRNQNNSLQRPATNTNTGRTQAERKQQKQRSNNPNPQQTTGNHPSENQEQTARRRRGRRRNKGNFAGNKNQ